MATTTGIPSSVSCVVKYRLRSRLEPSVHDIQDRVRPFADQIVPGDDLLQSIGGERVDTGKVRDDDVVMFFQLAFLFLHRDTRPVAYKLR